jgi:solute carrier family 25 carnitine/acylcarnitine transporter 20/29
MIAKLKSKKLSDLNMPELMLAGSLGGYFCWQFSYPQDVVKTILQTDKTNRYKPVKFLFDGGFFDCCKDIKRTYGWIGFWRGYLPCTIRGLYANAFLFGAYEQAKYMLEGFKVVQEQKEKLDVIEE